MSPKPEPAKAKKNKSSFNSIVICVVLALCAVRLLPITLIVVAGMIPTAVAYFVDTSKEKTLGPIVVGLNFAGVLPALIKLLHEGNTVNAALDILTQPFMLAMMLFPAACGWLLHLYLPYLVVGVVKRKGELRIKALEKQQQALIDQWGQVVTGQAAAEEVPDKTAHKNVQA